jgi:enoyl-CoA hydratase/carnithine racemase
MGVLFERDPKQHLAVITIDRPEAGNAINGEVTQGIESAVHQIEADDALWVTILTGTPPVLCAGADLREIDAGNVRAMQTERRGFAGIARRERAQPVIAAVDGPALAGGTEIALACDLVVASETATFGIPEVKRGEQRSISWELLASPGRQKFPAVADAAPRTASLALQRLGEPVLALSGTSTERIEIVTAGLGSPEVVDPVNKCARVVAERHLTA